MAKRDMISPNRDGPAMLDTSGTVADQDELDDATYYIAIRNPLACVGRAGFSRLGRKGE